MLSSSVKPGARVLVMMTLFLDFQKLARIHQHLEQAASFVGDGMVQEFVDLAEVDPARLSTAARRARQRRGWS